MVEINTVDLTPTHEDMRALLKRIDKLEGIIRQADKNLTVIEGDNLGSAAVPVAKAQIALRSAFK